MNIVTKPRDYGKMRVQMQELGLWYEVIKARLGSARQMLAVEPAVVSPCLFWLEVTLSEYCRFPYLFAALVRNDLKDFCVNLIRFAFEFYLTENLPPSSPNYEAIQI